MKTNQTRILYLACLVVVGIVLHNCSSQPDRVIPPEKEMHFPGLLALSDSNLAITSLNSDNKHSFGRLILLDTNKLAQIANSQNNKQVIKWSSVVTSNTLIPSGSAEIITRSDFVALVSRETNQLIFSPMKSNKLVCDDYETELIACSSSRNIALDGVDAFSLELIQDTSTDLIFAVGYLSSEFISLVSYDKNKKNLSLLKNINISELVKVFNSKENFDNYRYITRKILLDKSQIFILVERHEKDSDTSVRPLGAQIFGLEVSNLVNQKFDSENILYLNLSNFSIDGVHDFIVDDTNKEIIILAKIPESLVKINFDSKKILQSVPVCWGATSMVFDIKQDSIIVPCFYDNQLGFFSKNNLQRKAGPGVLGRGPSSVLVDPIHDLILVSLHDEGKVIILDGKTRKAKPAYLFNGAPENRTGS